MTRTPGEPRAEIASNDPAQSAIRRVAWRLTPFLLLLYVVAYLDRVNVGYAKLRMTDDLGWNETVFGLGTGLFFVGYFLLEIPGTILVESWSARSWFARIMISWGFCAAACGLIHSRFTFYALRLLLAPARPGSRRGWLSTSRTGTCASSGAGPWRCS